MTSVIAGTPRPYAGRLISDFRQVCQLIKRGNGAVATTSNQKKLDIRGIIFFIDPLHVSR